MAHVVFPFTPNLKDPKDSHANPFDCGLYRLLPAPVQQACQKNVQLLEYLHLLPIEQLGLPDYYPQVTRKLGDLKKRNLLYPVSDDTHIHILSSTEERDFYVPIEPTIGLDINEKLKQVGERMVDLAYLFAGTVTREEKDAVLLQALHMVCYVVDSPAQSTAAGGKNKGRASAPKTSKGSKIEVTQAEFQAIRYMLTRDNLGMGVLEPMLKDKWIEDISCSGVGPVFIEHKVFRSLRSAVNFEAHDDLDDFVLRLSEQIKRPVTMRNPIVDATLEDGSRINIVYGREVSQRGSNFSIRKAPGVPLSILELIQFGSITYQMAAYLSLMLEAGMNSFICGETASGKTTLINALTLFVPPTAKVVSIEDTPEVQVPHPNWIREVSRTPGKGQDGTSVSMLDLLKAALRQRPNLIIIGEIRGEEGAVAFQAMQTGHAVMATFHAATVEKLIQRLTGHPINVPKTYIENLNVAIIQSAVKLPNGKTGRRAISISEIVGYDPPSDSFSFVEVFRWNQATDVFEFVGDKNSYLLEERIAPMKGIPQNRKWDVYALLEKRAKVMKKLAEKGVTGYYELLSVLARAQQEGVF